MKKTKILFFLVCVLIASIFTMPLNAASNRIEVVTRQRQYKFKTTNNNFLGILKQEIVEEDLKNGSVTIELTFDNSKNTEIVYLIKPESFNADYETQLGKLKTFTESIFNTHGNELIKIGSVLVSNKLIINGLKSTISEVATGLDNFKAKTNTESTLTPGGNLTDGINKAKTLFTNNSNNKVLVVISAANETVPTSVEGIDFIINANIEDVKETELLGSFNATLIPEKDGTAVTMPIASYITNNFDVTLLNNPTDAKLNDKFEIEWNIGQIKTNEIRKIRYKLNLKKVVDESIVNTNLLINTAPTILFNGANVQKTDANECSPIIKILPEAVENPKTGVANNIVFTSTLLAVGAITYLIANKKVLKRI